MCMRMRGIAEGGNAVSLHSVRVFHSPHCVSAGAEVVHFFPVLVEVSVQRSVPTGIVRRAEGGHGATGNAEDAEHGEEDSREHPALAVPHAFPSSAVILREYLAAASPRRGRPPSLERSRRVPAAEQNASVLGARPVNEGGHLSADLHGGSPLLEAELGAFLEKEQDREQRLGTEKGQIPRRPGQTSNVQQSARAQYILRPALLVLHVHIVFAAPGVEEDSQKLGFLQARFKRLPVVISSRDDEPVDPDMCPRRNLDEKGCARALAALLLDRQGDLIFGALVEKHGQGDRKLAA